MNKIKELLIFSMPIIIGQVGLMFIQVGDIWVAGKESTISLAALGTANGVIGPLLMIGVGTLMGIGPVLSKRTGEGEDVRADFLNCLLLSFVIGIMCSVVCLICAWKISFFGFDKSIESKVAEYLYISAIPLLGSFIFSGIREYLQSFEKTMFPNMLAIFCIALNVFLNWGMVFGEFQMPKYGYTGLAIASSLVRIFMGIVSIVYAIVVIKPKIAIHFDNMMKVIKLGFPIALAIFTEVMGFSAVTLLVGKMKPEHSAANNIILTFASTTFMLPLAISSAVSVKVGNALGRKHYEDIKSFGLSSLAISTGFMLLTLLAYVTIPKILIAGFTHDPQVVEIAIKLLMVVAFFQLFDGVQVTAGGILRGVGVSKPIFYSNLIGYWVVGIPFGYYLAFYQSFKSQGLWIGLAMSLFCVALSLLFVLKQSMNDIRFQLLDA